MTAIGIHETTTAPVNAEPTALAHQDDRRPEGAAGDVWDALVANPGATPAELSRAAEVSRATTARALSGLERDGLAVRHPGGRDGGKCLPDRWTLLPSTTADDDAAAGAEGAANGDRKAEPKTDPAAGSTTDDAAADVIAADGPDDEAEETTSAHEGADGVMDREAVADARSALTAMRDAIEAALGALDSGDGPEAMAATETAYAGSGRARRLVRTAAHGRPRNETGRARSNPGEMRDKVAAHLAAHPSLELTPHEIGKVIGHSAGAIANALDRLVDLGEAVQTCERPRRFRSVKHGEEVPASS